MRGSSTTWRRTSSSPAVRRWACRRASCAARRPRPEPLTMLPRSLSALALAGACSALTRFRERAQDAGSCALPRPREVRAWLMRIHDAANHHNFQGTFVVSAGGWSRARASPTTAKGNNQLRAHRIARRANAARVPPQRHRPHAVAAEQGGADRAARSIGPSSRRCCKPATTGSPTLRRASRSASTASQATRRSAARPSRAMRTVSAIAYGPKRPRACCCARRCSASATRSSSRRLSPMSRSASSRSPNRSCSRCAARRLAGACARR